MMRTRTDRGFTLVELMIVIVIIGILATIAIPKFSQIIADSKVIEAKQILNQIIDLERTHYMLFDVYVAFAEGNDCGPIHFTQPEVGSRRFEYKFDIVGAAPFDNSIATATENQDLNGDGDTDDGLTITVLDVRAGVNDLNW